MNRGWKEVFDATRYRIDAGPPDEVLVVAAILGDLAAFDDLVRRYRAGLVRMLKAIVGPEHAEDVAQESLLLAFKALPSIEDPRKFGGWLSVIARHRAYRFGRVEKARNDRLVELDEVLLERLSSLARPAVEAESRGLAPSDSDVERDKLDHALNELPEDYALAMRLHYLDEMSLKSIGALLGVPVSTVKWRLHRGRNLVRLQMQASQEHQSPEHPLPEKTRESSVNEGVD